MPAVVSSRKRKQTEDMEVSPPKRVTRARAAAKAQAVGSAPVRKTAANATTTKSTKIMKTSTTKAVTEPSKTGTKTAKAAGTIKKNPKAISNESDTEMESAADEAVNSEAEEDARSAEAPPRARGRPKKAATTGIEEKKTSAAKPRGRPPKSAASKAAANKSPTKPKTIRTARVISQKAVDADSEDDELNAPDATAAKTPEPIKKRTTRVKATAAPKRTGNVIKVTAPSTRAAANAASNASTRATSATASTAARAAATTGNRRVAFVDEAQDKENRPVSQGRDAKETKSTNMLSTGTGVRGKPIRRAVANNCSTSENARPRTNGTSKQPSDEERPKTPLSPKKIDQVAKGNGMSPAATANNEESSEDELSGATKASRSPATRPLQKSPVKPPASVCREPLFAASNVSSPAKTDKAHGTQHTGGGEADAPRPKSKDGSLATAGAESLLARSPLRPPSSPGKSIAPVRPNSSGRPTSQDGEQKSTVNISLLGSPAKRPPATPSRGGHGGNLPGLFSTAKKRMQYEGPNLESSDKPVGSVKRSLLQSPARRPKVVGALTSVPKEKKILFPFGDREARPEHLRAFKFSAATPKRIKLLKPSQRLLDDVVEEHEDRNRSENAPKSQVSPSGTDTEGDTSMLDVEGNTIVYTPSTKRRTTLFDSPLVRRSRSLSPQKPHTFTPMSNSTMPDLPSAATSANPTEKSSRTLFRDNTSISDDELTTRDISQDEPASIQTPNAIRATQRHTGMWPVNRESHGMTNLADQLSGWLAASPEKRADTSETEKEDCFNESPINSPVNIDLDETVSLTPAMGNFPNVSPAKPTYFDDEMEAREPVETTETDIDVDLEFTNDDMAIHGFDVDAVSKGDVINIFEDSAEVTSKGVATQTKHLKLDENEPPIGPALEQISLGAAVDGFSLKKTETAHVQSLRHIRTADTLALNRTPAKTFNQPPREVLTVSKVPLKPANSALNASPIKAFRKKAKSMVPGAPLGEVELAALMQPILGTDMEPSTPARKTSGQDQESTLMTLATPLRTPRVGADALILRGAVVYVDVHTTEGADASGLFVELLHQMGARCVKQWNWNPRNSNINAETPGGSKVGITHVIFKDGGKRTLEKVQEAQGLVNCVGVGWVLDCERHNQWLDETDYAIDTSVVPRGGHNRRKSMEPTALANVNGTLTPARQNLNSSLHRRSASTPVSNVSPSKEFLNFSATPGPSCSAEDIDAYTATPTISGPTFAAPTPTINFTANEALNVPLPETPAVLKATAWNLETPNAKIDTDEDLEAGPTTPYFMVEGAKLVQATCPPKQQTGRRLFPVSGRLEDEPDEEIRRRLEVARRKSLQWAPRVASPLRRG